MRHCTIQPRIFLPGVCALTILFAIPALAPSAHSPTSVENRKEKYSTRFTSIFYSDSEDLHSFTRSIGQGLKYLIESPRKNPALTRQRVDRLVAEVMKILDMRLPDLHFSIHIYRDGADLDRAYKAVLGNGNTPTAFYSFQSNSIAVSIESVNENILAHEIAHAVICAYFGSPPPVKMQEILAQYVDRHLGEEQ